MNSERPKDVTKMTDHQFDSLLKAILLLAKKTRSVDAVIEYLESLLDKEKP